MRPIKLSSAIAGAAALLALAPAGALAARPHIHVNHKHSGPGGCHINLNVAPRLVTAGQPALAYGQLTCATPSSAASQTVTLYEHAVGTPGFTSVGTATTDEHGVYSLSTGVVENNAQFYTVADEARSGKRSLRVSAQVTLVGPPETTQLLTGRKNKVTFTGTVNPADTGAIVVLQRQNAVTGNEWHRIDRSFVKAGGVFTVTHTFLAPGNSNIRVLIRSDRRNIASASNELNYQISQAQNPNLTILELQRPDRLWLLGDDLRRGRRRQRNLGHAAGAQRQTEGLRTGGHRQDGRQRQLHVPRPVSAGEHVLQGEGLEHVLRGAV